MVGGSLVANDPGRPRVGSRLSYAALGLVRDHDEDAVLAAGAIIAGEEPVSMTGGIEATADVLFAVADGMGGDAPGAVIVSNVGDFRVCTRAGGASAGDRRPRGSRRGRAHQLPRRR